MIRHTLYSFAVVLAFTSPALAEAPPKEPPAEVTKLFDRLVGTWSASELMVRMGPEAKKATSRVKCQKVAGQGVQCNVQWSLPGMRDEETNLFGWDPVGGKLHMFAVNGRYAHDHVGTLEGDVLRLEFTGTRDGKPYQEQLTFTFKGPNELFWKDSCTLGGQVMFAGEGTYRK
jgi:hypothetical protein